jgi:hypothetical protein
MPDLPLHNNLSAANQYPPLLLLKMHHGPNAREVHHLTSTYPYQIWLTTPSLLLLTPPYGTSLPTLITAMIHFNT